MRFSRLTLVLAGLSVLALSASVSGASPRGRLVDIGDGTRLYLDCVGFGSPTVVIDGGAATWSVHYRRVQDELAAERRVCTYDRAGLGRSDESGDPRTASVMAEQLHRLLEAADEPGPFLLVGHSLGGYIVRVFQGRHPSEVVGLVLLESGHEAQWERLPGVWHVIREQLPAMRAFADRVRDGAVGLESMPPWPASLSPAAATDYEAAIVEPEVHYTAVAEFASVRESAEQVPAGALGDLPLVVATERYSFRAFEGIGLAVQESNEVWAGLQAELATLSTNAVHLVSTAGDHDVPRSDHEFAVRAIQRGLAMAAAGANGAARPRDGVEEGAPALELTDCRFAAFEEFNRAVESRFDERLGHARCGWLEVPENPDDPGRTLEVGVTVVPARSGDTNEAPLFVLGGGPGQAVSRYGWAPAYFASVNETRDLVFVDQRGTGRSAPLPCPPPKPTDPQARLDSLEVVPGLDDCVRALGRSADLTQYHTTRYVDDLDAVRRALGYDRINLWGGSYGTRVALVYLRRHPQAARAAVLQGVVHTAFRYPLRHAAAAKGAFAMLAEACSRDVACSGLGDLHANLAAVLARFSPGGEVAAMASVSGAEPIRLRLTRGVFLDWLRARMYSADTAVRIPSLLSELASGADFAAVVEGVLAYEASFREGVDWFTGLWLGVICSEDLPFITEAMIEEETGGLWFEDFRVRRERLACDAWPRGTPPEGFEEPVRSDVPVLAISGALDPVTAPAGADEALRGLSRSVHIVGRFGHILGDLSCGGAVIRAFLDDLDMEELDTTCLARIDLPLWEL